MARLHADSVIRPSYVQEVCRLLKASNINIVKNDLEFEENQENINLERQEEHKNRMNNPLQASLNGNQSNDLFTMDAERMSQHHTQAVPQD